MTRFPVQANISLLFGEVPFLERPAAAAAAGFERIECWWPFLASEPSDRELEAFVRAVTDAGVTLAAVNFDGGDLAAGQRGLVSLPAEVDRFRRSVEVAVQLAGELGATVLNALYGNRLLGVDPRQQDEIAVEQLAFAAEAAQRIGATVVVEALNPWESPHYPLVRTAHALAVIDRVRSVAGHDLACLYDLYHMQRSEGELTATIHAHAARFGLVQVADAPHRGEPGTGEISWPAVLDALEGAGYEGSLALELKPTTTTDAALQRMQDLGITTTTWRP